MQLCLSLDRSVLLVRLVAIRDSQENGSEGVTSLLNGPEKDVVVKRATVIKTLAKLKIQR